MRLAFLKKSSQHKGLSLFGVFLIAYVVVHAFTTNLKLDPQGKGNHYLIREYSSENQLAIFYPIYLAERLVRNLGPFYALSFNCEIKDEIWANRWMYGDGKHGQIWYDYTPALLIFFTVLTSFTIVGWKFGRFPLWSSAVIGYVCTMLLVFIYFSKDSIKDEEFDRLLIQKNFIPSVLWLTSSDTNGTSKKIYVTALFRRGGRSGLFSDGKSRVQLVEITSNHFEIELSYHKSDDDDYKTNRISFAYGQPLKTNWHDFQIEGYFPWYQPASWVPHNRKWIN